MKCFVGIDLGSTTSKAVVLDEEGRVLGRGITNSRSNYDMAARVARTEAHVNARFSLFRRAVERRAAGLAENDINELTVTLERAFRLEQYLAQLRMLGKFAAEELEGPRYERVREEVRPRLQQIMALMEDEAPDFFRAGARRKSDFFRDIAGASYQHRAQEFADPRSASFDLLLSLYDKSILRVENEPLELGFEANIGHAMHWALDRLPIARRDLCYAAAEEARRAQLEEVRAVGTGYGRARLPFPKDQIRSEILCHGLGAHAMFAGTRTVLDIGGQDTKAIQVDGEGIVTSFQMNDRCAAGCGRYLGYWRRRAGVRCGSRARARCSRARSYASGSRWARSARTSSRACTGRSSCGR